MQQLIHRCEGKIILREAEPAQVADKAEHIAYAQRLRLAGIAGQREELVRLHARNAIHDETVRIIEEALVAREMLLSASRLRG